MISSVFALALFGMAGSVQVTTTSQLPAESRQFDFWIGEWDVNLRIQQDDASWQDSRRAVAKIYPVLQGKAVLELWDESRIKGFSLRYFDLSRVEWVLWLNWPGLNRSGSSSLSGQFRHGRGDFYSTFTGQDGRETIARYSFNDITATSLRWDDAYSTDGGKTWSNSWIMEFSRTGDLPVLPPEGGPAHTFVRGDRCSGPEFDWYQFLAGRRDGKVYRGGTESRATLTGYRILDGCAVLVTLAWQAGDGAQSRLSQLTYNTRRGRHEILDLDSRPESAATLLFGSPEEATLTFADAPDGETQDTRMTIIRGDQVIWTIEERDEAGSWQETWRAIF